MNHVEFDRDLLAQILRLQADRAYRDAHKIFYIEGVRNFIGAIDNHLQLITIIYSEKLLTVPPARKLLRQARRAGTPCCAVSPEQFRQISRSERASGIGAIVRQPWLKLTQISADAGLCWLVLDRVRSPGNLGTLIRTSEAFGGAGFIFLGQAIDPFSPDVVRASMGAMFRQTFVRTDLPTLQKWAQKYPCPIIGASPQGNTQLHQWQQTGPMLLFLGEERQGLTSDQQTLCQQLVRIPMTGAADSLNLAMAGSVILYELHRARLVTGAGQVPNKCTNIV
jgi:RNA methyltransferase, TrmH family